MTQQRAWRPLYPGFTQAALLGCLAVLLWFTFRLFAFSYFWLDDFNNLYWVQQLSLGTLLWDIVNPASTRFRPVGLLLYWLSWRFFDLFPAPYHFLAWAIHAANVLLLYYVLQRILRSDYAAAFGSLLFAFQGYYWEIFWSFGTVFELLATFFFLLGFLIFLRSGDSLRGMLLASAAYVLAIKSKEMAITLPAIWLFAALFIAKTPGDEKPIRVRALLKKFALPLAIAIWFTILKVSTLAGMITSEPYSPTFAYYISLSPRALVAGYAWYFEALAHVRGEGWGWVLILGITTTWLLLQRDRSGLFFLLMTLTALLPVVIFPNHRFAFFWYLPFVGICGLAGWFVKRLSRWVGAHVAPSYATTVAALLFLLACRQSFVVQERRTRPPRDWARGVSEEYRAFVEGLRKLPAPPTHGTIYYESVPQYFDAVTARTATQVIFRRTDLEARVAPACPSETAYCVRFQNGSVSLRQPRGEESGAVLLPR